MSGRARVSQVLGVTTLAAASFAQPLAAQTAGEPPKLAVSVAAGVAVPVHGDFNFNAREWQVAVRREVSPHFLVEGFFDQWRRSFDDQFGEEFGQDPSSGLTFTSVAQQTTHVTSSVGVSALLRGSVGRLTVTGGGGPGYLLYQRKFRQDLANCQAIDPQLCQPHQNTWRSDGFSLHGVVGADIRLTDHFSVLGQFKFTGPVRDFGSAHSSVTAGVRVGIR